MINPSIIKNMLRVYTDRDLRAMRRIILDYQRKSSVEDLLIQECDQIFKDRLTNNPKALKMSFWKDHFEWQSLAVYPEIKDKILDFGCGSGHSDIYLARTGRYVHGVDMSPLGIRIANYLRENENGEVKNRLSFAVVDITKDHPNGELFASAWSSNVFEHVPDPGPLLLGLRKWLKPGAFLLISVPFGNAYDDPGHINHYYDESEIRVYLNNHLNIQKIDISEQYQMIRVLCTFD